MHERIRHPADSHVLARAGSRRASGPNLGGSICNHGVHVTPFNDRDIAMMQRATLATIGSSVRFSPSTVQTTAR